MSKSARETARVSLSPRLQTGAADATLLVSLLVHDRPTRWTGGVLLAACLGIVALHVAAAVAGQDELVRAIGLTRDGSASERFGHGILFLGAGVLLVTYFDSRDRLIAWLSLLFLVFWVDDTLHYHERVGD